MQYTELLLSSKNGKFQWKNVDVFLNLAQNIECGYTLESPRPGGSNKSPQSMFWSKIRTIDIPLQTPFFHIKVGFMGVYIARTCFPKAT